MTVDANNVTDTDVVNSGKYFVYALFIALGAVIGIMIIVALAVYVIKAFNLGGIMGRK